MFSRKNLTAIAIAGLLPITAACGGGDGEGADASQSAADVSSGGTDPSPSAASVPAEPGDELPQGDEPVELDAADFTADIDNEYWPMKPGTRWTYKEIDEEGKELKVVVTVSTETKEIANGITARIVRDTVTEDGELIEDTFDWYSQDADGNIWYLGEDTAEFENGKLNTRAGSFEAGVDGALPGIIMPADPEDGMKYRQEYYKGEAEDNGEVLSLDERAEVPYGQFKEALLTKDTITIEPDVLEYKLYAPGVGPVLIFGVSGGGGREELTKFDTVGDDIANAAGTVPLGESYT